MMVGMKVVVVALSERIYVCEISRDIFLLIIFNFPSRSLFLLSVGSVFWIAQKVTILLESSSRVIRFT